MAQIWGFGACGRILVFTRENFGDLIEEKRLDNRELIIEYGRIRPEICSNLKICGLTLTRVWLMSFASAHVIDVGMGMACVVDTDWTSFLRGLGAETHAQPGLAHIRLLDQNLTECVRRR